MKTFKFTPTLTHHAVMSPRSPLEIENEPILFQCSFEFAMEYGGVITKEFLQRMPETKNVIIDTRSHMLMKTWCPAIPGYHTDHVPRSLPNAQPDLTQTAHQTHYMAVIGDSVSSPEFVTQPITLQIDETKPIYRQCNEQINALNPDRMFVMDNNIWKFSSTDFHRATPAIKDGWRFFVRSSYHTGIDPKNKIRKQVQVYMDFNRSW